MAQHGGAKALAALLSDARGLAAPRVGPNFDFRLDFWPHGVRLTEEDARGEMASVTAKLRAARERLNAISL